MITDISREELQDILRARAQTVPAPAGLALRAAENARRVRRRRRVVAASALVVVLAALSPLVIRELVTDRQDPVRPVPTITSSLRWSETVPGLELPLGGELSVAYAVDGIVTVGAREVDLEGAEVSQILDSALGAIVVAQTSTEESDIWVLDDSTNVLVAEDLWLTGSVAQGLGYDGQTHIAYAVDGPDGREIFAGPVLGPHPLGNDDGYVAVGFLGGEPVYGSVAHPMTMTQFHTADSRPPRGGVEFDVVGRSQGSYGAGTSIPGWWDTDDGAVVFFQTVDSCNSARVVPGTVFDLWGLCYEVANFGRLAVGPTYGAMRDSVYDIAGVGHEVITFDLPRSSSGDTTYDLEALGWETPTDVIIRVAAYDAAVDIRDRSPADGSYVAVRCSVDTGACERVPHPVEVVANAVNKID